jgi:hypothetical protein
MNDDKMKFKSIELCSEKILQKKLLLDDVKLP